MCREVSGVVGVSKFIFYSYPRALHYCAFANCFNCDVMNYWEYIFHCYSLLIYVHNWGGKKVVVFFFLFLFFF